MAVERTYTIVSVAFNGATYNSSNGGPLGLTFDHRGDTVLDRTADDIYSPAVIMPERNIMAGFRMRQLTLFGEVPGAARSNLVFTVTAAGRPTSNYVITISDMVLADMSSSLQRSIPGEMALSFVHEHVSGTFAKT